MDRRTLLTSIAGAATVGACTAEEGDGGGQSGRPTLAIDSEGPGRWRIRSWKWQGGAWRPQIARAKRAAGGIEWSGPINAADRAAVLARLSG
ncbi:MAG: hypothetical protein JHC57_01780 [Sphingopyxis sp.]|uniref:hypothetical protein n=1 Tax=Sphingopyxis sp. TaxID=1908224 RepID=UPI001A2FDE82|nr:hypothetical protein [Sphingopyxis sp.]MBJ7498464.1 hypothetical protein [Sphingopyxis sp.]